MQLTKLFLALALAGGIGSAARSQSDAVLPPHITVSGDGEARVDPDVATVRLGVQAQSKTAQDAQSQVNASMQKIMAGVLKTGVDKKDIQTGTLSLQPVYSGLAPNQTEQKLVGYRATNMLIVRVMDVTKTGAVVDASISGGANNIDDLSFGLQDETAARQEAIKRAVRSARAKAEAMAEALGVKLGKVYEASEAGVSVMPMSFGRTAMAADAAPIAPGQVGVSANITLKFLIAAQ